jgi:NADH:ubiquinone oxidoreductase subunit 4 (subunit M)
MQLHLPWLHLAALIPLIGAVWISRLRHPETAQKHCLIFTALGFACALGAWADFATLHDFAVSDSGNFLTLWGAGEVLVIDELSAPLFPLAALSYSSPSWDCYSILLPAA